MGQRGEDNELPYHTWTQPVAWKPLFLRVTSFALMYVSALLGFQTRLFLYHGRSLHLIRKHLSFCFLHMALYPSRSSNQEPWSQPLLSPVPPLPNPCVMSTSISIGTSPAHALDDIVVINGSLDMPFNPESLTLRETCFLLEPQGDGYQFSGHPLADLHVTGFGRCALCPMLWDCDFFLFQGK